ncbi:MAG: hypothetical protein IKF90_14715 [Parasporobacterium sp.]|nr:hypothetical protein [Parasporobacterium sp.]
MDNNKPSKEQIENRAVKLMLSGELRCKDCKYNAAKCDLNCSKKLMETALEEAQKGLTGVLLTESERMELRSKIELLQQATGHIYTSITFLKIGDYELTHLYFNEVQFKHDVICGRLLSYADELLEDGKIYEIKVLLSQ